MRKRYNLSRAPALSALARQVYMELHRRIEKVNDRIFEGEEPMVHLMG
jgi:hypothetical protein